jgi:hypothetical protein
MKQRIEAIAELTGVRGDSARGKNSGVGPGRPDRAVLVVSTSVTRECITA